MLTCSAHQLVGERSNRIIQGLQLQAASAPVGVVLRRRHTASRWAISQSSADNERNGSKKMSRGSVWHGSASNAAQHGSSSAGASHFVSRRAALATFMSGALLLLPAQAPAQGMSNTAAGATSPAPPLDTPDRLPPPDSAIKPPAHDASTTAPPTAPADGSKGGNGNGGAGAGDGSARPPDALGSVTSGDRLSEAEVRELLEAEEARRRARRRGMGRRQEMEEIRSELAERKAELLEKERELLLKEQTVMVLREELEIEKRLRLLLIKEKEKAAEEAALAMGLCGLG